MRLRDLCATRESQQRVDAFLAAVRKERTPQKATLTLLGGEKREIVYCHVFGLSETCEGSDQLSITFGFQVLLAFSKLLLGDTFCSPTLRPRHRLL